MKFLDLFAGIGGFRLGMEQAGHTCIGFCEIDKFARASYKAIYDTRGEIEMHDITKVTDEFVRGLGHVDVICGGFPCQSFSLAGNRRGFEDTRGTLFFEIARFASILKPKYLFLENVLGLLNHEGGLRSKQSYERWMTSGMMWNGKCLTQKISEFPKVAKGCLLSDILEEQVDETYFLSEELSNKLMNLKDSKLTPLQQDIHQVKAQERMCLRVNSRKKAIPVLTPDRMEKRQNGRRFKNDGDPMFTLTAQDKHGVIVAGQLEGGFEMSNKVYDPNGTAPTLRTMQGGGNEPKIIQRARGYNQGGQCDIAPTLTSNSWHENNLLIKNNTKRGYTEAMVGDSVNFSRPNSNTRRGRVGKQLANTLLTGEERGVVTPCFRIRKLTPRECWRLQGFPDWAFDRASAVNSNSQLYKQAGNSVTVPVITAIARRFM